MVWYESIFNSGKDNSVCLQFEHRVSYGQMRGEVETWCQTLKEKGIGPDSTVALQLPPSFTYIYILLALWRSGAQVLLFDHRFKPTEVEEYLTLCQPQFYIFSTEKRHPLSPFREEIRVITQKRPGGRAAQPPHCLVQFTSGSMGKPKVIGRTGESLIVELERFSLIEETTTISDRVLILSSLTHTWGLVAGILHSLYQGATLVFSPTNQARDILRTIADMMATVILGVPFHYDLLNSVDDAKPFRTIRIAVSGGEKMLPDVNAQFQTQYGVSIGQAYGMTEVGIIAADFAGKYPGSVGRVASGIWLELRDNEIYIKLENSPYLVVDDPHRFAHGWLRTYDMAEFDEKQRILTILGRADSLVSVGGLKVNLTEVEAVLRQYEGVDEAIVLKGDEIEAYIGSKRPLIGQELLAWCKARLADYKIPKRFFISKTLPRTATGKILRSREILTQAVGGPESNEPSS